MKNNHLESKNDILKTLLYFDTFNYPITLEEISNYSSFTKEMVREGLAQLVKEKLVHTRDNFYSVSNNHELIEKRRSGNNLAKEVFKKAKKVSKFIGQFPFVEAVFLSGSLSKGTFHKDDDVDYFIITSPNRLWLARTLLILYKKVFLLNSKKYFCVNYFMTSNALTIQERNRFTATELVTLKPMSGNGMYRSLQQQNTWVLDFFPNYDKDKISNPIKKNGIKKFSEFILKGNLGNFFEGLFMKITQRHQQRKFQKMQKEDFAIAFKGTKTVSKHHPDNHQERVIRLLNDKILAFNKKHQLNIPLE